MEERLRVETLAVVLDATLLERHATRETTLELSEPAVELLFEPCWTEQLLQRSVHLMTRPTRMGAISRQQANEIVSAMQQRFPRAMVNSDDIAEVQKRYHVKLPVQPDDNHLLAAAMAAPAWTVVTFSLGRLKPYYTNGGALLPEALAPSEFLLSIERAYPKAVREGVHTVAMQYHQYEKSHSRLLSALRREGMAHFADRLSDMEDVFP